MEAPSKQAIAIMAKAPQLGRVKTRLVPPLTEEKALQLYVCLLKDTISNARQLENADLYISYTPIGAESAFTECMGETPPLIPQLDGNLGERLYRTFSVLFDSGYQRVCAIDSDSPTLPTAYIHQSFDLLGEGRNQLVLGPASDGGYYIIALANPCRRIFEGIKWSTKSVFETTLERATEAGLEPRLLPEWYDVDTVQELKRLRDELLADHQGPGFPAPSCRQFFRSMGWISDPLGQLSGCLDTSHGCA